MAHKRNIQMVAQTRLHSEALKMVHEMHPLFLFPLSHFSISFFLPHTLPSSTFLPVSIFHINLIVDDLQYLDEADIHSCRPVS